MSIGDLHFEKSNIILGANLNAAIPVWSPEALIGGFKLATSLLAISGGLLFRSFCKSSKGEIVAREQDAELNAAIKVEH